MRSLSLRTTGLLTVLVLGSGVLAASAAMADGPPGPPPYPKIFVTGTQDPGYGFLDCWDSDGTPLYSGRAWTVEPLVRGPLFAPVVLWLPGARNQPVVPLEFASFADMTWRTVDDGTYESGKTGSPFGRPVAYGGLPTDPAPRVSCTSMDPQGYFDFGTYVMTPGLVRALSLPTRLVGRAVAFDNEGAVTFTVRRTDFPLTATSVARTLRTADRDLYRRVRLDGTDVRCLDGSTRLYGGRAHTFAPLSRGYQWAPMAFWLKGDRIVTPRWFTSDVSGTWETTDGPPSVSGALSAQQSGTPSAYGKRPWNVDQDIICRWSGVHDRTRVVTVALAEQLNLPAATIGRTVHLSGKYRVDAYVPSWLFPPAS